MGRAPRGGEGAALTNRQLGASNPVFSFAALAFSSLLSQFCSVLVNCTISSLRVTDREARLHLSARLTRVAAASRVRRYGPADRDGPCRRAECRDVGHIGGSRLVVVPCPAVPAGAWRSRSRYSFVSLGGSCTPSDHRTVKSVRAATALLSMLTGTLTRHNTSFARELQAVLARAPASAHCGSRPRRSP